MEARLTRPLTHLLLGATLLATLRLASLVERCSSEYETCTQLDCVSARGNVEYVYCMAECKDSFAQCTTEAHAIEAAQQVN